MAGGACNYLLARWWMVDFGPTGIAWAGGIGTYLGCGAVAIAYFIISRTRLNGSTYFALAWPVLLVLPLCGQDWILPAVWTAVLVVALTTSWFFTKRQKKLIFRRR